MTNLNDNWWHDEALDNEATAASLNSQFVGLRLAVAHWEPAPCPVDYEQRPTAPRALVVPPVAPVTRRHWWSRRQSER